jgi:nitric oxide reductase subunit B
VSEGFWYARSAEFLQQPIMQLLVWMRMPGDVIFSIGVLLLVVFVAKLWLDKARHGAAARDESQQPATVRRA